MKAELFIAHRLRLGSNDTKGSPSLNVALGGIVLAIVVMILSLSIVMGFKSEVANKLNSLDAHIKVNAFTADEFSDGQSTVNGEDLAEIIKADKSLSGQIADMSLVAEWPVILKTMNDFNGLKFKGVDSHFDWSFIKGCIVKGRVPCDTSTFEIALSLSTAKLLKLKVGDKVLAYFINDKVKVRNCLITGLFQTNFDTFDKGVVLGNISVTQGINGWDDNCGSHLAINVKNLDNLEIIASRLQNLLYTKSVQPLKVSHTRNNNAAYYTWLSMLDMNEVVILTLMFFVAAFTLVAAMLMIVLGRIKMIGLLKATGATNGSVRRVFVLLTLKLLLKAMVIGNVLGLSLAFLQKQYHIVKLDPASYYMPWVPIELSPLAIVILNVGFMLLAASALLLPSLIISSIKPVATMRYE